MSRKSKANHKKAMHRVSDLVTDAGSVVGSKLISVVNFARFTFGALRLHVTSDGRSIPIVTLRPRPEPSLVASLLVEHTRAFAFIS